MSDQNSSGTQESALTIRSAHVRLLVTNFDKEFRFFRDVLGFKPTFGKEGENYADFDCHGYGIALFKRDLMADDIKATHKPIHSDDQDKVALIFGVPNVDAAAEALVKQGISLVTKPHDRKEWGIRVAHFRDPDGNLVEINQGLSN